MAKKKTKSVSTANDAIVVEGVNIPQEVAVLFSTYYNAFLARGFSTQQAFELTQQMATYYLWK